ncbi:S-layer homology domain-containing protein [Paenibacillus sp. NPDC058174]|uniref:S-layer homology domain-containing protein n=1 Tax=Paenibacillus sp. NPDC058174 TaxID=3346366 RepID=UPI0036DEBF24
MGNGWTGKLRSYKRSAAVATMGAVLFGLIAFGLTHAISAAGESVDVNNVAELQAALQDANNKVIKLAPGDYALGNTPLKISRGVTLIGASGNREGAAAATRLIASGNRAIVVNEALDSVFADVALEALTITGGQAPKELYGGGGINADTGTSTLSLYNVVVANNSSHADQGDGGGMYVSGVDGGKLELDRVIVKDNKAADGGGGLYVEGDIQVNIIRTSFERNVSGKRSGGALDVLPGSAAHAGPLRIEDSAFIGNAATASSGGALSLNVADTVIQNSTFSGNKAVNGGAIVSTIQGSPVLKHITVTNNSSTEKGGGLYISVGASEPGMMKLSSSIISGNTSDQEPGKADIFVDDASKKLSATDSVNNVIDKADSAFGPGGGGGNLFNIDAKLEPLADNGGFTKTHALKVDSPARSTGGASGSPYDQRGFPRMVTDKTAAGAFEGQRVTLKYNTTYTQSLRFQDIPSSVNVVRTSQTAGLIKSENLTGSGNTRTLTVVPNTGVLGNATYTYTVNRIIAGQPQSLEGTLELVYYAAPDLTVEMTHSGDFYQGQQQAAYTITVKNEGIAATNGTMKLKAELRNGLTAVAMSGANWTCSTSTLECTRSAVLAPGGTSVISLTANVADTAVLGPLDSKADVSGGGEEAADSANNNSIDATKVQPVPNVVSVAVPANATYKAGDILAFTVSFDRAVTVTGTPELPLVIGTTNVKASYNGGSGTAALRFEYKVASGLADADGISVGAALGLNGGSIVSAQNAPAKLGLSGVAATNGVLVDAIAPSISAIQLPANGIYTIGQQLEFIVKFDERVSVGGTPELPIKIGGRTVHAAFTEAISPTDLKFVLTVSDGDNDNDGIELGSALSLSGGAIADTAGNPAVLDIPSGIDASGIKVDTEAPSLLALDVPAAGAYKAGSKLVFAAEFNEEVTVTGVPRIPLKVGENTVFALYESGSGSKIIQFSYTVTAGDNEPDGLSFAPDAEIDLNGATLKDKAGYAAALSPAVSPAMSGVIIDTVAPVIQSVVIEGKKYTSGSTVAIEVQLSEAANVATGGGTPRLPLKVAGSVVYASYTGGDGTSKLAFAYTPDSDIRDLDGIELEPLLSLNGGAIADPAGNALELTIPAPLSRPEVIIDTITPKILSVSGVSGYYKEGDAVKFTIKFNDAVVVNTAGGKPQLPFSLGTKQVHAVYESGSGFDTLVFSYTAAAGDANGEAVDLSATTALLNGGGSIGNASGNTAQLSLAGVGDFTNVIVDSAAPSITAVTASAPGTYALGDELEFVFDISEAVDVHTASGSPELEIAVGSHNRNALYDAASSTNNKLVFRYTVSSGDYDMDGIQLMQLKLNQAVVQDQAGNLMNTALPAMSAVIKIDAVQPFIESVDGPAEGYYSEGSTLTFKVQLNKSVQLNNAGGTPSLKLIIGSKTADAALVNTASNVLTFTYTVTSGDTDEDGIGVGAIALNGGVLTDSLGNLLDLTMPAVSLPLIIVDTTAPNAPVFLTANGTKAVFNAIEITGTAEAGSLVTLATTDGPGASLTATAAANGSWSMTVTGLPEGDYRLKASAADAAGNISAESDITITVMPVVAFNPISYSLVTGNEKPITLEATFFDGSKKDVTAEAVFTSDHVNIAEVRDGKLYGVGAGSATLTASWSGITLTAPVTVLAPGNSGGGSNGGGGGNSGSEGMFDFTFWLNGMALAKPISLKDVQSGYVTLDLGSENPVSVRFDSAIVNKLLGINDKLIIQVATSSGSVEMPLKKLLQQASGANAPQSLTLEIAAKAEAELTKGAEKLGANLVAGPFAFTLGYEDSAGKGHAFPSFKEYVLFSVPLGTSKPPYGSAVLKWDGTAGEFRYVPALFRQEGGRWIADAKDQTSGIYVVLDRPVKFDDTAGHWGEKDIALLASMFVIKGKDNDSFDPNGSITRAEFAALLTRVLGLSSTSVSGQSYTDVKNGWYADAVKAASAAGIVNGYSDGTFHPGNTVSREEMAVMMMRALQYAGKVPAPGAGSSFKDQVSISGWALEAVQQASQLGLAKGDASGAFRPGDKATRAEAAAMLLRLMREAGLSPW